MSATTDYIAEAKSDAIETVRQYLGEMVSKISDGEEISDDLLNDYSNGDAYHHETHVDREYGLQEAAAILDQLSDYEETDSGLWESLEPRKAISAQAAYTYGNAVYHHWRELIEELNNDSIIEALRDTLAGEFEGSAECEAIVCLTRARIEQILSDIEQILSDAE